MGARELWGSSGTVAEALERLDAALDDLGDDPTGDLLGTAETVQHLLTSMSRLQAVIGRSAERFRHTGIWVEDGAKTPAAWLATKTRLPKKVCARTVRLGRMAIAGPTAKAWLAGQIGESHVAAIASIRNLRTEKAFRHDEREIVERAKTLRFDDFERYLAYWSQAADPDGADDDDQRRRDQRDVYLVESFGGTYLGRMVLDPISGVIVSGELARLETEMFEVDWAEAKIRLGRDPLPDELERTPAQRRADALVEMATRSASTPADARRPAPLFSVLVDYPTMAGRMCQLASGRVVSPGSLTPWLDDAYIERAVFGLGRRVEVSEKARLFTGATRRAVELRDLRCAHPTCDVPIDRCQVDHIIPFEFGGPTIQENGRLLCGFHNRLRNRRPPSARPSSRPPRPPRRT